MQKARVMEEEPYVNGIPINWPLPIHPPPSTTNLLCHFCNASAALLFCRNHSAFFCLNCDAKLHLLETLCHHRVLVCELCERAPAAMTCKADSASLCIHCDAEIHSANPLSRRHDRVPVAPIVNPLTPVVPIVVERFDVGDFLVPTVRDFDQNPKLQVPAMCPNEVKSEDLFFPDFDPLLDFDLSDPMDMTLKEEMFSFNCSDGVVPIHHTISNCNSAITSFEEINNSFNIDFKKSKFPINTTNPPIQTATKSFEVPKPIIETTTQQVAGTDREARVMRYKEKRKNRKFEKTIRYASRKAYAEIRPRIKGRFAKRSDQDMFSDLVFESDVFPYIADHLGYRVVPSL